MDTLIKPWSQIPGVLGMPHRRALDNFFQDNGFGELIRSWDGFAIAEFVLEDLH